MAGNTEHKDKKSVYLTQVWHLHAHGAKTKAQPTRPHAHTQS